MPKKKKVKEKIKQKTEAEKIEIIATMLKNDWSVNETKDHFGISDNSVYKYIRLYTKQAESLIKVWEQEDILRKTKQVTVNNDSNYVMVPASVENEFDSLKKTIREKDVQIIDLKFELNTFKTMAFESNRKKVKTIPV